MTSKSKQRQRQRTSSNPAYDPWVYCQHTSDLTYTRNPCSCGRTFWPPRGRGRGESLLSPRRIEATLRTSEILRLRIAGMTYAAIGRRLGMSKSGVWRAERRAMQSTWR